MENKAGNIETRRQVETANPESHERRVKTLSQLVLSASIRAARKKASGNPEPASVSDREALDFGQASTLGSVPKQLSFDLDSGISDGFEAGRQADTARSRRKKERVDLSNVGLSFGVSGECETSWNQLWTRLLDFQQPETESDGKQATPEPAAPSPSEALENEDTSKQLPLL